MSHPPRQRHGKSPSRKISWMNYQVFQTMESTAPKCICGWTIQQGDNAPEKVQSNYSKYWEHTWVYRSWIFTTTRNRGKHVPKWYYPSSNRLVPNHCIYMSWIASYFCRWIMMTIKPELRLLQSTWRRRRCVASQEYQYVLITWRWIVASSFSQKICL